MRNFNTNRKSYKQENIPLLLLRSDSWDESHNFLLYALLKIEFLPAMRTFIYIFCTRKNNSERLQQQEIARKDFLIKTDKL